MTTKFFLLLCKSVVLPVVCLPPSDTNGFMYERVKQTNMFFTVQFAPTAFTKSCDNL